MSPIHTVSASDSAYPVIIIFHSTFSIIINTHRGTDPLWAQFSIIFVSLHQNCKDDENSCTRRIHRKPRRPALDGTGTDGTADGLDSQGDRPSVSIKWIKESLVHLPALSHSIIPLFLMLNSSDLEHGTKSRILSILFSIIKSRRTEDTNIFLFAEKPPPKYSLLL